MKVPVKLLPNRVDQGRVFVLRERIDPLCPERDGEADQEYRLDQNNRKFQVSRDAAGYTVMQMREGQKWTLPQKSFIFRPVAFGNQ